MMCVITHRGLDPSKKGYFAESSREAFFDQLERGFGLEFDVQPDLVLSHDADYARSVQNGCHNITLPELIEAIQLKQFPGVVSALHLKYSVQTPTCMNAIIDCVRGVDPTKLIIFDTVLQSARYLKERLPQLCLAPSVAHSYDIERYGAAVGGTLLSLEEVLANRGLFDWVWLDEWDRLDRGGAKKFYTEDTVKMLREAGFKIALVSPELHATSPGLLGGEVHDDARDWVALGARMREIVALGPDAICTDYPDFVRDVAGSR